MEGTVTISIKEYERLKDLPHVTIAKNKELELQLSDLRKKIEKYQDKFERQLEYITKLEGGIANYQKSIN